MPVTEGKAEPKYHYDYSIQAPAEQKPVETPERQLYARVVDENSGKTVT